MQQKNVFFYWMLFNPNQNISPGLIMTSPSPVTLDLLLFPILEDMECKSLLIPIITEISVKSITTHDCITPRWMTLFFNPFFFDPFPPGLKQKIEVSAMIINKLSLHLQLHSQIWGRVETSRTSKVLSAFHLPFHSTKICLVLFSTSLKQSLKYLNL